ncbi:hypothetical protein DYP60_07335 [Sphaerochaeta halotolerans]|uniref:Uncharacterized protein n=1 Tax=Sphaerochaeta halotolerans TaxID=2293840 RepID=A0A372MH11_9SPIR|nr:hypothetical protein [Sphaerochaeta halotolerans]RFU95024.1 hypothetical protein DYP60_07335 [Sphaerochaeta halotolerans]
MKKKFVLTLALVLVVAGTLVAATPIEVSGSFSAGYDFEFTAPTAGATGGTAELVTVLDFTGDFWKVSLANGTAVLLEDAFIPVAATAEIYLDKALAEQGVDMGDLAVTLHVGDDVSGSATTVLADPNDWAGGMSMATVTDNFGLTVKYSDLVEVYASVDPSLKALPMVISAKFMPIDGVDAAVGFTNDANGVIVSAAADIASLVGLEDIALSASVEDIYLLDAETNELNADVNAEVSGVGLWVAYQMTAAEVNKLAAKASYSTTVQDFGLSASFKAEMADLADIANTSTYTIEAGAGYAMGGVNYALDAAYVIDGTFTLSPSVSISF